jgi:hypothetical protein
MINMAFKAKTAALSFVPLEYLISDNNATDGYGEERGMDVSHAYAHPTES